jgi:excinuclease ABC subunit B
MIEATKVAAEEEERYTVFDGRASKGFGGYSRGIERLEKEMRKAAQQLDFERAAALRDKIFELKKRNRQQLN